MRTVNPCVSLSARRRKETVLLSWLSAGRITGLVSGYPVQSRKRRPDDWRVAILLDAALLQIPRWFCFQRSVSHTTGPFPHNCICLLGSFLLSLFPSGTRLNHLKQTDLLVDDCHHQGSFQSVTEVRPPGDCFWKAGSLERRGSRSARALLMLFSPATSFCPPIGCP